MCIYYMYESMNIYIYMTMSYACVCMHVCMYACMHAYMYVCMYVYVRMHVCMYVCNVCM